MKKIFKIFLGIIILISCNKDKIVHLSGTVYLFNSKVIAKNAIVYLIVHDDSGSSLAMGKRVDEYGKYSFNINSKKQYSVYASYNGIRTPKLLNWFENNYENIIEDLYVSEIKTLQLKITSLNDLNFANYIFYDYSGKYHYLSNYKGFYCEMETRFNQRIIEEDLPKIFNINLLFKDTVLYFKIPHLEEITMTYAKITNDNTIDLPKYKTASITPLINDTVTATITID